MSTLVAAVKERIKSEQKKIPFEKPVLDAMELADKFESVKPEEYVLPLDAMAGFRVPVKSES
jgi:hypothetical protein